MPGVLSSPRSERLPLLDGLRGIAAIGVLYRHAWGFGLAAPFATRGHLFVDLFFMLSGFVLGLTADPKLRTGGFAGRFLFARICRLWPVMTVGTLIGVIPFVLTHDTAMALALLPFSLVLIPTLYLPGPLFPLNEVAWSLSMELIANVFHAFLLSKVGQWTLAVLVTLSGVLLLMFISRYSGNVFGNTSELWLQGLPRLLFSYGFGLLIARERLAGNRLRRLKLPWWLCVIAPVIVVVDLPAFVSPGVGDALATVALFPILFVCATNASAPKEVERTFTGLGLLSYPLYAVHMPIMALIAMICGSQTGDFLAPAAALVVAALLAHVFERRAGRAQPRTSPSLMPV